MRGRCGQSAGTAQHVLMPTLVVSAGFASAQQAIMKRQGYVVSEIHTYSRKEITVFT